MTSHADDNLGYWCSRAAESHPDEVAVFDATSTPSRRVTYRELEAELDAFAHWLTNRGLVPGERLLIVAANRYEYIVVMFGAMRAGLVPVPVNVRGGRTMMRYVIGDADARVAVVDVDAFTEMVSDFDKVGISWRISLGRAADGWQPYQEIVTRYHGDFFPPALTPASPSFQPYTSGTTGKAKGVVLTHEGQLWWIRTRQKYWPYTPSTRSLVSVPLFHKNAMAGSVKPVLFAGGSIVLLDRFEPRLFLTTLSEFKCTMAGGVPTVFQRLLEERALIRALDFSALTLLRIGSAPASQDLIADVRSAFGCDVTVSYGLTEGGPIIIGPAPDGRPTPPGSCGTPWPEGEVKLIDAQGREQQTEGQLCVRNPGVLKHYFRRPEITSERLQDGWLKTGDLFRRDSDNFFYFLGRSDDMFSCAGENIYPKEVEDLLRRHPQVLDACVVPLSDPLKGHVPVALVVRMPGTSLGAEELQRHTLRHGAAYAHPRRIAFAREIPQTGTGKVDRSAVQKELADLFLQDLAERRDASSGRRINE